MAYGFLEVLAAATSAAAPILKEKADREDAFKDARRERLARYKDAQNELNRKKDQLAQYIAPDLLPEQFRILNITALQNLAKQKAQGREVLIRGKDGVGAFQGFNIVNPTPGTVSSADRIRLSVATGFSKFAAVGSSDTDALRKEWDTIDSITKKEMIKAIGGAGGKQLSLMYTIAGPGFAGLLKKQDIPGKGNMWDVNTKNPKTVEILEKNGIDTKKINIDASNRARAIRIIVESQETKDMMFRIFANRGVTPSELENIKSEIENNQRNFAKLPVMADKASAEVGADAEEPTSATQLVAEGAVRWLADEYSKERFYEEIPNALSKGVTKSQHINVLSDNILEDFKRKNWIMKDRTDEVIMQYIIKYLDEQYDMAAENL
jgi:hypothetical protein